MKRTRDLPALSFMAGWFSKRVSQWIVEHMQKLRLSLNMPELSAAPNTMPTWTEADSHKKKHVAMRCNAMLVQVSTWQSSWRSIDQIFVCFSGSSKYMFTLAAGFHTKICTHGLKPRQPRQPRHKTFEGCKFDCSAKFVPLQIPNQVSQIVLQAIFRVRPGPQQSVQNPGWLFFSSWFDE